jgi:hypothetical protein
LDGTLRGALCVVGMEEGGFVMGRATGYVEMVLNQRSLSQHNTTIYTEQIHPPTPSPVKAVVQQVEPRLALGF